jgi:starvation-inducible DNA-binding protein
METNIEIQSQISDSKLSEIVYMLNGLLADEYVLCNMTRDFIKQLRNERFYNLQKSLEAQLASLDQIFDDVLKKNCHFGNDTTCTHKHFLEFARIICKNLSINKQRLALQTLLEDHETIIETLKTNIATANNYVDFEIPQFLDNILNKHKKMVWSLKAHLSQFSF